jgi:hypothetical protein
MSVLDLHPLCTLFPRLEGAEFDALKADIIANGQREPITVHEGLVLDGGNRYRACVEAGIEPRLKEFDGADPVAFVLSANLHRRHLQQGQQAVIVARAQDWAKAQAVGRPAKSGNVAGLNTVADRAGQSGASERTQRMADKVARQSPELAQQVAHGKISLPKALEQLAPRAPAAKQSAPAPSAPQPAVNQPPADTCQPTAQAAPPSLIQQVLDQRGEPAPAERSAEDDAREADPFDQLMADFQEKTRECDELRMKITELTQHVELLTRADLASQVDGLVKRAADAEYKFEQICGRNRQLQQTARDAQTAEQYQADLLAKIRRALGVESNSEILPAISARRAA